MEGEREREIEREIEREGEGDQRTAHVVDVLSNVVDVRRSQTIQNGAQHGIQVE